jgi:gluconate 2-dehydrogenase gamma chain
LWDLWYTSIVAAEFYCGELSSVELNSMNRRRFLKSVAVSGVVAGSSWSAAAMNPVVTASSLAPGCRVLTVEQAHLVDAMAEQIVPEDDYPGAKEAGAVAFIDGVLAGHYGKFYKERYKQGLPLVDEVSRKRFDKNYVSLTSDEQIRVLKALESGEAAGETGKSFFGLFSEDCMEAYYGDPKHGGNRDEVSWKMINFVR